MIEPSSEILEEIKCPICKDILSIPIHQCLSGHSICDTCKVKVNKCPLCKSSLSNIRNFTLERLLSKMLTKCMHTECKEIGTKDYIKNHYKMNCEYLYFGCEATACKWFGSRTRFPKHLNSKHKSLIVKNGANLKTHQFRFCVIQCRNQFFWVKRFLDAGTMFWTAQHMTGVKKDKKYYYKVTITNKEGEKYISRQLCQKHNLSKNELKNKYVCFSHCNFRHENMIVNIKIDPNTPKINPNNPKNKIDSSAKEIKIDPIPIVNTDKK